MSISSKGLYGLSAMYYLSTKEDNKPTQIKEIAQKCDIPQNYLEQILVDLKKNKLLTSVRGAYGGYLLAKDASEIKVIDVLQILEGQYCVNFESIKDPIVELLIKDAMSKMQEALSIPISEMKKYEEQIKNSYVYVI
jgi:Rrf2 family protein